MGHVVIFVVKLPNARLYENTSTGQRGNITTIYSIAFEISEFTAYNNNEQIWSHVSLAHIFDFDCMCLLFFTLKVYQIYIKLTNTKGS